MSRFQKRALRRSLIIGIGWLFFSWKYLSTWRFTNISGFLTILSLWLWIGRKQEWIWGASLFFGWLTLISLVFSIIPIYTAKPSLDAFYATKFPTLTCLQDKLPTSLLLWGKEYAAQSSPSLQDICARAFPIYVWQPIHIVDTWAIIINLGNASSIYIQWPTNGTLQKNTTGYTFLAPSITQISHYTPNGWTSAANPLQVSLAQTYKQEKKDYLEKNYPRTREQSSQLTKIAMRKMKILGLFNREFNEYIKNLEFYLTEKEQF